MRVVPLAPHPQHIDAVLLKLIQPLLPFLRALVESRVIQRIKEADAGIVKRLAVLQKRRLGDCQAIVFLGRSRR